jgi:hypothetical protein
MRMLCLLIGTRVSVIIVAIWNRHDAVAGPTSDIGKWEGTATTQYGRSCPRGKIGSDASDTTNEIRSRYNVGSLLTVSGREQTNRMGQGIEFVRAPKTKRRCYQATDSRKDI